MIVESQIEKLKGKISSSLSELPDSETSDAKKNLHDESSEQQLFAKEYFSALEKKAVQAEATGYRVVDEHPDYQDQIIKQQGEIAEGLKDDRNARKRYGLGIFLFVFLYIGVVMSIFCWHIKMGISDSAIIALLISTNINIIGLLAAVVRYLFPRRDISLLQK